MNLENEQQEFEQLELFSVEQQGGALILSFEDDVHPDHMLDLKAQLQELVPEGCRVIVMNRVRQMLYVPGIIK